ncbi:MAG: M66 family metalloprotease [Saprospiraceae bacterium]
MRLITFLGCICLLTLNCLQAQNSLGTIQNNTNLALPNSYNFQEYVFAEPNDQGNCTGAQNNTATIDGIFMAQTHRHEINHPFFFTIGHRPALLQVAVTGSGTASDVQVEGRFNGNSLGTLCLAGPANLTNQIDLNAPNFSDYFSVTLPKSWVKEGLSLIITAGNQSQTVTSAQLKIGPKTELNLVMVNMDVMDYNISPHNHPIFQNFLQEVASAIPASTIRFGVFPETLVYPEVVASGNVEQMVRLTSRSQVGSNGVQDDGFINSIAVEALGHMHNSTGDSQSTIYFGNTLNLAPGGWGGGGVFVSFDYTDVFIHELGHALSLPHWGNNWEIENPEVYQYLYPYGGDTGESGGRGETWNFIQDIYEFIDPTCQVGNNNGSERSDAMQRNASCLEKRSNSEGPWDGFGDFSALAMHRYLVGGAVQAGQVSDRGQMRDYQFSVQNGFPTVSLQNGERVYTRDPQQPQFLNYEEEFRMPGEEQLNRDAYLIYGSAHETQAQANIVYRPIEFNGTIPPVVDPTDPATFALLKTAPYDDFLWEARDITFKMTFTDGTVRYALNPYHSYQRSPYNEGFGIFRRDVISYSLVVPADKELTKVELYNRPFCVRGANDPTPGNINYAPHNITAANFMDGATFQAEYDYNGTRTIGSNTIGNRVWNDLNRNGMDDNNEPGIKDVSMVLWTDEDGDGNPTNFSSVVKTDVNGYYSFGGLEPGFYRVFVWQVDNWGPGEPLENMTSIPIFTTDPNTDTDLDNNATGEPFTDIFSGIIELTADGEPLNDGDREDDWFNFDPSGNMTIDFAFYQEGVLAVYDLGFQASLTADFKVLLEWQTQTAGIDFYTIERSTTGKDWQAIGQVNGDENRLQFIDNEPINGENYYRISWQNSNTNAIEHSNIQSILIDEVAMGVKVFPNPTRDDFTVTFIAPKTGDTTIEIFNTLGQIVAVEYIRFGKGENRVQLSMEALENGTYFVKIDERALKRVVKI